MDHTQTGEESCECALEELEAVLLSTLWRRCGLELAYRKPAFLEGKSKDKGAKNETRWPAAERGGKAEDIGEGVVEGETSPRRERRLVGRRCGELGIMWRF